MTNPDLFTYCSSGSYCPVSEHEFAEWVASDIYEIVKSCFRKTMEIEFYTPPYDQVKPGLPGNEMGLLVLHFRETARAGNEDFIVGLRFGQIDDHDQIIRRPFNADSWQQDNFNPFASRICLANLDEAWRVICLLGLMLQIQKIEISYGAYT